MKQPLCVYILKHPDFSDGLSYSKVIYSEIYRDIEHQTNVKSSVPVYFTNSYSNEDNQLNIDFSVACKIAIVLFMDAKMILDKEHGWKEYLNNLYNMLKDNDDVRLFPVSFVKESFCVGEFRETISNLNFIRLHDKEDGIKLDYMIMKLRHELCRMLYNLEEVDDATPKTEQPVKLFLSHAKNDGLEITNKVRDYINNDTGIRDFFDAVDIAPGKIFLEEIEKNILDSKLLLIFQTDNYSMSEWCKKEVLIAKIKNIPMLIINCLFQGEERSFPYLGNAKTMRVDFDDRYVALRIISCALEEVLRKESYRQKIITQNKKFLCNKEQIKYNAPELLTLNYNDKENTLIVYPEPPLGRFEFELLKEKFKNIDIVTPTILFSSAKNLDMSNYKVAISISECESSKRRGVTQYHCQALILELSRYLLKFGSTIIYGGDINYQTNANFTRTLIEVVRNYSKYYGRCPKLQNYVAGYLKEKMTEEQLLEYYNDVEFIFSEKTVNKANDLTSMRKLMTDKMDVRIVAGGKLRGFSGKYQGVLEEFVMAIEAKKAVFVIGSLGGITEKIADAIEKKDHYFSNGEFIEDIESNANVEISKFEKKNYESIVNFMHNLNVDSLNNGLDLEDNRKLFNSINYTEIISLILKGIKNISTI